MKKLILIIPLLFILIYFFYPPVPTYNPFDDSFNVSIKQLTNNGCKLLYAPCGYATYGKEINGHLVYYQFSPNETNYSSAKGISIHIDSIKINDQAKISTILAYNNDSLLDSELNIPKVDSNKICSLLKEFQLQNVPPIEKDLNELVTIDLESSLNYTKRTWFFEDMKGQQYSGMIEYKLGSSKQGVNILIRTLDFFIIAPRK